MNATINPRPQKRRQITPLMWAGGGTLLLHGAFWVALWLWPQPPAKHRETLLEVDLQQDKPQKVAAVPKPESTPKPKIVPQTRVARAEIPKPLPKPVPVPTFRPVIVPVVTPKPVPVKIKKIEVSPTAVPVKVAPKPEAIKPKAKTHTKLARTNASETPRSTTKPDQTSPGSPSTLRPNPADNEKPAPSSGSSGRRFARNEEPEGSSSRSNTPSHSDPGARSIGSNTRRQSEDAANGEPDVNLPRTRARRSRNDSLDKPAGSAPTSSADGTEVNLGPSNPTSSSGGSRRALFDTGDGDADTGAPNLRGLKTAGGFGNNGTSKTGRGTDEAGDGTGNSAPGTGTGRAAGRGRGRSRLTSDPFSNPGDGNGKGTSDKAGPGEGDKGNGTGLGPKGGTRLAKRNLGDDGTDGDGGLGRSIGLTPGDGLGGRGNTRGTNNGGGGGESADGGGSDRNRDRRGRGGHREIEAEDQIGRGIWGGFKIRYYQDKADHPDLPDGTFHPGNPIDWPVFTKLVAQKTEPNLDFDWGTTPPAPGMKYTFWSMKAAGRIFVPKDDTYEFFFDELDDAGSLVLDGKTIIKIWQVQKSSPSSGKMFLKRGPHDIQIEYIQGPATAASIKLSWRSTSFPKEIVGVYQAPEKN